jgi:hypothetical protein
VHSSEFLDSFFFSCFCFLLQTFVSSLQEQFKVEFTNDDQRRVALATLAEERNAVELNNILFNAGESDHLEAISELSHIPGKQ